MSHLQIETVGRALELPDDTPVNPARSRKGRPMWIYDGEQWIEEGASESETKPERTPQQEEMFYPELQVIEIVPVPNTRYVPLFPAL